MVAKFCRLRNFFSQDAKKIFAGCEIFLQVAKILGLFPLNSGRPLLQKFDRNCKNNTGKIKKIAEK